MVKILKHHLTLFFLLYILDWISFFFLKFVNLYGPLKNLMLLEERWQNSEKKEIPISLVIPIHSSLIKKIGHIFCFTQGRQKIKIMRTILSVIELTNETENSLEIMDTTNTTLMVDNKTNHSEECGVYNDEYQIISSTVQVRVISFVYLQLIFLFY